MCNRSPPLLEPQICALLHSFRHIGTKGNMIGNIAHTTCGQKYINLLNHGINQDPKIYVSICWSNMSTFTSVPPATPSFIFRNKCFRRIWRRAGYFAPGYFHIGYVSFVLSVYHVCFSHLPAAVFPFHSFFILCICILHHFVFIFPFLLLNVSSPPPAEAAPICGQIDLDQSHHGELCM